MQAVLIRITDFRAESRCLVSRFPLVIGRSKEADLPLNDPWLSRRHCEIIASNGVLVVRDLGSRNGTLVNGCEIQESPLLPGDRLTVGRVTYRAIYERSDLQPLPEVVYADRARTPSGP